MLALLCPGQGAQRPGFATAWLEDPVFAAAFTRHAEASGIDLVAHGTTSDEETIRDTAVAQPLIVAASLAAAAVLRERYGVRHGLVVGHSVGEVAAAALAGVLTETDAVRSVAARGRAMAAAAARSGTGMSALTGGEPGAVQERLAAYGLTAATVNGARQVVAAGPLVGLAALAADPPPGTQVDPLRVAGAFCTTAMAPAAEALRGTAVRVADPVRPLLSNADGALVDDGQEMLGRLLEQVVRPVRWDLCMASMRRLGVSRVVELPPAGPLTGLVRRELPEVEPVALRRPAELDRAVSPGPEPGRAPAAPNAPGR